MTTTYKVRFWDIAHWKQKARPLWRPLSDGGPIALRVVRDKGACEQPPVTAHAGGAGG